MGAKDPATGIAHMSVTGGDTTDMKEIFEEKQKEDTYIDGAGNECALKKKLNDKEAKKRIKEIGKKLSDAAKGKNNLTEEEQWELRDELELLEHKHLESLLVLSLDHFRRRWHCGACPCWKSYSGVWVETPCGSDHRCLGHAVVQIFAG